MHLVRARLICGSIRSALGRLDETVGQKIGLDFFPADIWQHVAIDLDARAEHLAAFLDHFLALSGIVDDVAVFERQIVFTHNGAHALAPAASWFQISYNFRFVHSSEI